VLTVSSVEVPMDFLLSASHGSFWEYSIYSYDWVVGETASREGDV
jgi:hypothetical protein